jgi:hypothetical protein
MVAVSDGDDNDWTATKPAKQSDKTVQQKSEHKG